MQNRAAWLTELKAYPFKVDDAPTPTPSEGEVLIRNHAVAINPVDCAVQTHGILYDSFPAILGEDVAGEVVAVGPGVTKFKPGDRVTACFDAMVPGYGAFQLTGLANETLVAKIPDNVSYAAGAVLPLALMTASMALFAEKCLGLPYPQLQPKDTGKTLVVWGGSTSVGSCAIQMARATGLRVIATCSKRNFEYCKGLGAELVFDYNNPSVVEDILDALKDADAAGVMVSILDNDSVTKGGQIAHRLPRGQKILQTVAAFDVQVPKGLPEDIEVAICFSWDIKTNGISEAIFGNWLSPALESGLMKCKPDPKVIGQGLEKIQEACDTLKAGVSASKIVVELP